jgi:quinol monooxygenase YgiN
MGELSMLVLSGTFTAKADKKDELVALAAVLLPQSRKEPGCLRYDFLQDALNPERFVFFELWKSRDDLNAHFQTPHFQSFAQAFPEMIVGEAEILTYETAGPAPAF